MTIWQISRSQMGESFVTWGLVLAVIATIFALTSLDDEILAPRAYTQMSR
jgi:flagellar motor component MotA